MACNAPYAEVRKSSERAKEPQNTVKLRYTNAITASGQTKENQQFKSEIENLVKENLEAR